MVHLWTSHSAVTLQCQHCNVIVFTLHCLRDHERIKHHSKSCQHWPVTSTENTITANTSLSPNYRLSCSTRVTRALGGSASSPEMVDNAVSSVMAVLHTSMTEQESGGGGEGGEGLEYLSHACKLGGGGG